MEAQLQGDNLSTMGKVEVIRGAFGRPFFFADRLESSELLRPSTWGRCAQFYSLISLSLS
jgi:hypothetical protein